MDYRWSLIISFGIVAALILFVLIRSRLPRKNKRWVPAQYIMILGLLVSLSVFFWPFSREELGGIHGFYDAVGVLGGTLHNTLRLFLVDGDYFDQMAKVQSLCPAELHAYYRAFGAVLYVLPPLLTFGTLLSFVKNLFANVRYFFTLFSVHVFSELNERSLALAKSITEDSKRRHPHLSKLFSFSSVVFTDVVDKQEESYYDLVSESEKVRAILFHKDLESLHFRRRLWFFGRLNFYLISEDESEKLRHAGWVMQNYDRRRIMLYVFSNGVQSEMFLATKRMAAKTPGKKKRDTGAQELEHLKVVRVNDIQALVYHNLDRYGTRLFHKARTESGGKIHAVIVGVGQYGQEMIKALSWFCQVPNFRLTVTAFEKDRDVLEQFSRRCPAMIEMGKRGYAQAGEAEDRNEAHYSISLNGGVDVKSPAFFDALKACKDVTHVFVSLGNDERNIETAVAIRAFFEGQAGHGPRPDIETVVYDSGAARSMGMTWHENIDEERDDADVDGIKNRRRAYRIHMIGDLESFYSVDTVLDSALVEAGLRVHLRYCTSDDASIREIDRAGVLAEEEERRTTSFRRRFTARERRERAAMRRAAFREVERLERLHGSSFWMLEYNYRSSIAKALHERLRKKLSELGYLKLPSVEKAWGERTDAEKLAIGEHEHIRWNAYMRSEGYTYSEIRNDIAKQHNLLCSTDKLRDEDLRKDA